MANGVIAVPATSVVIAAPEIIAQPLRKVPHNRLTSPSLSRLRAESHSYGATRATTAANDISKLGSNNDSGATRRMASAARATLRMVRAGRSSMTAIKTMLIMIQERTVGTAAPDRAR